MSEEDHEHAPKACIGMTTGEHYTKAESLLAGIERQRNGALDGLYEGTDEGDRERDDMEYDRRIRMLDALSREAQAHATLATVYRAPVEYDKEKS